MARNAEPQQARNSAEWLLRGLMIDFAAVVVAAAAAVLAGALAMGFIQSLPHLMSTVGDVAAGATGSTDGTLLSGISNGASKVAFYAGLVLGLYVVAVVGLKVMRDASRYLDDRFALLPPPYRADGETPDTGIPR